MIQEGLSWIRLDMLDVGQIFLRQNRFYTFPSCPLFRVCVSWAEQGQTWKALAAVGKCDRFEEGSHPGNLFSSLHSIAPT